MNGLTGKVVVVTGGAKGIGAEYSLALAKRGCRVVVADIDGEAVKTTIKMLTGQGFAVFGLEVDVTKQATVQNMITQTISHFGCVNALVNNAAIYAPLIKKPFLEINEAEWDWVMSVNLKGMFLCCQAAVPEMKKLGKGSIVNISSSSIYHGVPGFLHYVSSKAGVVGLTRGLAREVAPFGIRVNAVAPGLTAADTNVNVSSEYQEMAAKDRAIQRVQIPGDLVGAVAFLISDDAGFMTGQTLVVDGGLAML